MGSLFGSLLLYVFVSLDMVMRTNRVKKVLCIIPVPLVRWVLVALAFGQSGYFLVANVYPILATVSQQRNSERGSLLTMAIIGRSKSDSPPCHNYLRPPRCVGSHLQSPLLQLLHRQTYRNRPIGRRHRQC